MKKLVILSMAGALALALLSENAVAQSSFYVFGAFGNTDSDVALGGLLGKVPLALTLPFSEAMDQNVESKSGHQWQSLSRPLLGLARVWWTPLNVRDNARGGVL